MTNWFGDLNDRIARGLSEPIEPGIGFARTCHPNDPHCLHPECNCGTVRIAASQTALAEWASEILATWERGDIHPDQMRRGRELLNFITGQSTRPDRQRD
jgi:hypothetical protein